MALCLYDVGYFSNWLSFVNVHKTDKRQSEYKKTCLNKRTPMNGHNSNTLRKTKVSTECTTEQNFWS